MFRAFFRLIVDLSSIRDLEILLKELSQRANAYLHCFQKAEDHLERLGNKNDKERLANFKALSRLEVFYHLVKLKLDLFKFRKIILALTALQARLLKHLESLPMQ